MCSKRVLSYFFCLLIASQAQAQTQTAVPSTSDMLIQVFGALTLVVSLIFGVAWLTKRLNLVNGVQGGDLRVLSSLTLGRKEKVVIVEACGKKLLLGVSAQGVNLLNDLTGDQGKSSHTNEATMSDTKNALSQSSASDIPSKSKTDFSTFLKNIITSEARENKN